MIKWGLVEFLVWRYFRLDRRNTLRVRRVCRPATGLAEHGKLGVVAVGHAEDLELAEHGECEHLGGRAPASLQMRDERRTEKRAKARPRPAELREAPVGLDGQVCVVEVREVVGCVTAHNP